MTCDTTVLTGTSGAFWYKPANTVACLTASAFPSTASANLTIGSYLGFRVNDPVTLVYNGGATPATGLPAGNYYIVTYDAEDGVATLSSTLGGTAINTIVGAASGATSSATLSYRSFQAVGQVRDWTFEITRAEIDVTTIGQAVGQYAPFRSYVTSFADGTGTATVYFTDGADSIANRIIEDVIQRKQTGAAVRLYLDQVTVGGTVSDALSRFIETEIVLTSASMNVNPDDAQQVSINFRPSGAPTFDLKKTA